MQARVCAFAERVCGHGWAAVVPGGAAHTVLAPQRYWFTDATDASHRGTLAAVTADGSAVLMDTALNGAYEIVPVGQVAWTLPVPEEVPALAKLHTGDKRKGSPDYIAWTWRRPQAPSVAVEWLRTHGTAGDLSGHGAVHFPPRRVVANVGGAPRGGWVVGWDAASGSALVALGLYVDPHVGSAAVLPDNLSGGEVVAVTEADLCAPATGVAAVKAFLTDASARTGARPVVCVGTARLPALRSTAMPGAHFEHLTGHRGGDPWMYAVPVPGELGPLFAHKTVCGSMEVMTPEAWDVSAAIPILQACKRLRDALQGAW